MKRQKKKYLSLLLSVVMVFAMAFPSFAATTQVPKEVKLTILGTSDMHGNLTSWSYESQKDYANSGFARVATLVKEAKTQNPNTLVIDNGDTIQGTILTDDLYNTDLTKPNPVIDVMNFIGYDAMTLGNHEFNFGMKMVDKLEKEADFPILSANIYNKKTGEYLVEPYVIKEVEGIKVGILGLTVPSIMSWDANKEGIKDYEYKHMADEAEKYVKVLKEKEKVDVIVATAHAGLESRHEIDGGDAAKLIAERCPEIDVLLVGHDHQTVNETINGVLVAAPYKDREVVRFDLTIADKKVTNKTTSILKIADYESDQSTEKHVDKYHKATLKFLEGTIGKATEDFHPKSEVKGIPEAQVRDTALIDLINQVQLEATGADVAAAALFKPNSNLPKGDLNFANVFDIYQYANTLVGVEVTGKELKNYMEWSASYYNTYKPGDLTVSFNASVRGYAYDMFQGVDYKIDISKPVGKRITDVMYKGEPLEDDTVLKLAINDYRYSGIGPDGSKLISGKPYYESAPKALRTYIREYIEAKGTITPVVDNNWEIIGNDWNPELRAIAIKAVNEGDVTIPVSADGRTANVKSITEADLIEARLHPEYDNYMAIVHTNDTHTRIEEGNYDGMGLARVATHIDNLEARYGEEDILVLDAGDTLHGIPLVTVTKGEAATKIFNLMGYDAMTAGNHDFNYGYERLLVLDEMLNFPIVTANVIKEGKEVLTPYIIKEAAGKKVAIFGLSTPETVYKTHPNNVKGLNFEDPIQVAKKMVKELEGKADVIVALTHLGLDEGSEITSKKLAEQVNGIDIIVDGHSHTTLSNGEVVNGTTIVQTGEYDKNIGQVDIYIKKDGTFKVVPTLLDKQDGKGLAPNEAIVEMTKVLKQEFEAVTSEVLAKIDVKLEGAREQVRAGETNLGNLITNALIATTGADVALVNGGGIRASIEIGEVTKKNVIEVLPFGNTGVMIEATGAEIIAALENGVKDYPTPRGAFAHVGGMSYTFDASKTVGNRIVEVLIGGKPIEVNKTYKLATNDFIAAGGDEYEMFKDNKVIGEYSSLDELVIKYLQEQGTKDTEVTGRVKVVESERQEKTEVLPNAA